MTREIRFYLAAVILLFMGFFNDTWRAVSQDRFYTQNRDMEAQVVCRLIMSRQNGIFFAGGLTGQGAERAGAHPVWMTPLDIYSAYVKNERLTSFYPYLSHHGGQAMVLCILDRWLPLSPLHKLHSYFNLVALLSAAAIGLMLAWIRRTGGVCAGWVALGGSLFSAWLTVFGRNLWWFLGVFYIPFLLLAYQVGQRKTSTKKLAGAAFAGVFIKCFFSGFEFITAAMLMMVVPLVYHEVAQRWTPGKAVRTWGAVGFATVAALGLSALLLCYQVGIVTGSFRHGMEHLIYSWEKRTSGGPHGFTADVIPSLHASRVMVLSTYLKGYYFWRVTYWHLLLFFGAASMVLIIRRRHRHELAYLAATWFSLLAPLSWFIIFKAHAFMHTHMDFIVWQMPFTLLGFGLAGLALEPSRKVAAD